LKAELPQWKRPPSSVLAARRQAAASAAPVDTPPRFQHVPCKENRATAQVQGSVTTEADQMARETGTVERFMDDKGFGFVKPDSGGKDVFVHHSAIEGTGFKSLSQGDRIEFDLVQDPKGPRAENVRRIEE
jgi:cold shock protein